MIRMGPSLYVHKHAVSYGTHLLEEASYHDFDWVHKY